MSELLLSLAAEPLFGIVLCVAAYAIATFLNQKLKTPLANPLLIAGAMIILLLQVTGIPLESFQKGGSVITMLLGPATVALAVSIHRQIEVLKKNFLPVVLGCLAGAVTSMVSAYMLSKLFGLDDSLLMSLLPKSVTTPIAMEISRQGGGVVAITVAAVVITGILGAVCAPLLCKLFGIKESVAQGVAIGTCSHALGTSRAITIGEIQGAMSGIAIGVSGIITVFLALFF